MGYTPFKKSKGIVKGIKRAYGIEHENKHSTLWVHYSALYTLNFNIQVIDSKTVNKSRVLANDSPTKLLMDDKLIEELLVVEINKLDSMIKLFDNIVDDFAFLTKKFKQEINTIPYTHQFIREIEEINNTIQSEMEKLGKASSHREYKTWLDGIWEQLGKVPEIIQNIGKTVLPWANERPEEKEKIVELYKEFH